MAGVFELPPGPGVWCDSDSCNALLCRFLIEPREQPANVLITRYPRLVRAFAVLHPEVRCFSFTSEIDFLRAQSALHQMCLSCEALIAEPGMTVEQTIVAVEEQARLFGERIAPKGTAIREAAEVRRAAYAERETARKPPGKFHGGGPAVRPASRSIPTNQS
jgi:hypothetical protein